MKEFTFLVIKKKNYTDLKILLNTKIYNNKNKFKYLYFYYFYFYCKNR
jgi:hypothetical protein